MKITLAKNLCIIIFKSNKEIKDDYFYMKISRYYNGIYKDMFEVLGEDITLKIYEDYRGQQVTFPMRLYSKFYILDYVRKNFDGSNIKKLSRELGYTEKWLKELIKRELEENNEFLGSE